MKLSALFSATLVVLSPSLWSASPPAAEGPVIRALLARDVNSAFVEAKGQYRVQSKETGSVLSSGSMGKRFVIHAIPEGLRWGEEFPDTLALSIVPASDETLLYVDGMQYKGAITVYTSKNNRITVVNEVPIEDYLKSTLALQIDKPFATEAMSAIAIVARTNTYALSLASRGHSHWDVIAADVGYFGHGVTLQKNRVEEIVDHTRNMVLFSKKSEAPLQRVELNRSDVEELADRGFDARRILQHSFPHAQLEVPRGTIGLR